MKPQTKAVGTRVGFTPAPQNLPAQSFNSNFYLYESRIIVSPGRSSWCSIAIPFLSTHSGRYITTEFLHREISNRALNTSIGEEKNDLISDLRAWDLYEIKYAFYLEISIKLGVFLLKEKRVEHA